MRGRCRSGRQIKITTSSAKLLGIALPREVVRARGRGLRADVATGGTLLLRVISEDGDGEEREQNLGRLLCVEVIRFKSYRICASTIIFGQMVLVLLPSDPYYSSLIRMYLSLKCV
jgi:hypothetical protein